MIFGLKSLYFILHLISSFAAVMITVATRGRQSCDAACTVNLNGRF